MQNLQNELINILQHEDALVVDGQLNKNKIVEMALQVDPRLIKHLIKHDTFKTHFFTDVERVLVFDKIKFQRFVNNKSFLPDSYTAFKNKIGLTINDGTTDNYITTKSDVVLAWPHKDCVLEGGQTKEDQKRNEIFWNETLAPDEIDRLLDPKVFTNWKKYDQQGEHEVTEISDNDNLIIKGNNLLALASLKKRYTGKVKLIYIDPPYNTGFDFGYNDKFNHASWMTFIKTRLYIAKSLLSTKGTIWVNIDDREGHYLKILLDEIFGRDNFVSTCVWQKIHSTKNDAKYFSENHDYIFVYAKNKENVSFKLLDRTETMDNRYKNIDNDERGPWQSGDLVANEERTNGYYEVISPKTGKVFNVQKGKHWVYSKERMEAMIADNTIWFGKDGNAFPRKKRFLSEVEGRKVNTWWESSEVGHNQEAKREIIKLFGNTDPFGTPKPERLLKRIIEISTDETDIVLDFFMGSATTQSVALKMKRRFIGVEQMDYINTVSVERLKKVIGESVKKEGELLESNEFDTGGISKDANWQGGGSFIYCELAKYNQTYADQILEADNKEKLIEVWQLIKEKAFLSYQFDKQSFDERIEAFKTLSLDDQKKFLLEVLDKNQLYVNYSEIADETFGISKEDKRLNDMFYGKIV